MDTAAVPYKVNPESEECRLQQSRPYKSTHDFCNRQAIEILKNDGFRQEAILLESYLNDINAGTAWADRNLRYTTHYYNPFIGRGLRGWNSAKDSCIRFFMEAVSYYLNSLPEKAFFSLGAAAHLVQDICVPFHARNIIFSGHQQYEHWVAKRAGNYAVHSGGLYVDVYQNAGDWIDGNAKISYNYINEVKIPSSSGYHPATLKLLARTQRSTAGFFCFFINRFFGSGVQQVNTSVFPCCLPHIYLTDTKSPLVILSKS